MLSLDELFVVGQSFVALENRPRVGVRSSLASFELSQAGVRPVQLQELVLSGEPNALLRREYRAPYVIPDVV